MSNVMLKKMNLVFYVISFSCFLLLYYQTLHFAYLWDDLSIFVHNPLLAYAPFSWDVIAQPPIPNTSYFRPLVFLSWFIEFRLFGQNSTISHAINAITFYLTVIFVYHLLLTLLVHKHVRNARLFATIGALVYLFHPVQVESVAWVSGRFDVFCGFFIAAGFLSFLCIRRIGLNVTVVSLCFIGALGSKEQGVLFLPGLYCLWMFYECHDGDNFIRKTWLFCRYNAVLLCILLVILCLYLWLRITAGNGLSHLPFNWNYIQEYYFNAQAPILSLHYYIVRALLPFWDSGFFVPISYYYHDSVQFCLSWLISTSFIVVIGFLWWKKKVMIFPLLGFLVMISLVMYLLPIAMLDNVGQDRFLYSPMIFYVILFSFTLVYLNHFLRPAILVTISVVYLGFIGMMTVITLPTWSDEFTMWRNFSKLQYPYTKEVLLDYFRVVTRYGDDNMVDILVNQEKHEHNGNLRPEIAIIYANYLIKNNNEEGLNILEVIINSLPKTYLTDKTYIPAHNLFKRDVTRDIYLIYAAGLLGLHGDIDAAKKYLDISNYYKNKNEEKVTKSIDLVIALLEGNESDIKKYINMIEYFPKLKAGYIRNAMQTFTQLCAKYPDRFHGCVLKDQYIEKGLLQ